MRAHVSIREAIDDPKLLGAVFRRRQSWAAWRAIVSAAFGCALSGEEHAIFTKLTGRAEPPATPVRELWCVKGRRGGGSFIGAVIACYMACFKSWRRYLGVGERAVIPIVATDRRQSMVIMRYVKGIIAAVPMLARRVERELEERVELAGQVTIEVHTCSFRAVRGHTVVCAVLDELAFWKTEDSANPDVEVLNAIRPAMATIPDALLVGISSPYARRGILWNAYKRHYGQEGDPVLVVRGATRELNPTVPQSVVDEAMEADPASASAEYLGQFRADVESFIDRDVVEAAVVPGRYELPPLPSESYVGFGDAAGGSGSDSFAGAVAFLDRATNRVVLAAVRETRPPFSPASAVAEHAALFRSFGVRKITLDRWGGNFPIEAFRAHQIEAEVSERAKSDLYRDFLPLINSGRVKLLDNNRLVAQLCGLERRVARGGRDSIDHVAGSHDDLINCAAGALVLACSGGQRNWIAETDWARINATMGLASAPGAWGRQRVPLW